MGVRCLVVDDAPHIVRELQDALRRLLAAVEFLPVAQDGLEALRRIRDHSPDLLLLDLAMPRMDGLTTLRALGGRCAAKTIAIAPESLEGGRAAWEALTLGARDFIVKRTIRRSGVEVETCDPIDERLRDVIEPLVGPSSDPIVAFEESAIEEEQVARLPALVFLLETRHLGQIAHFLSRHGTRLHLPIVLQVPHPPRFTRAFREGLDRVATMPVRIAVAGERLAPGQAVLVPGGQLGELTGGPGNLRLKLSPIPSHRSRMRRRTAMLHALLGSQAAQTGVAVADRLPTEGLEVAGKAVAEHRLLRLSAPRREGDPSGFLRMVRALRVDRLSAPVA